MNSVTIIRIPQARPELTADESPNFTVFWRVKLLSASPSQIASLERFLFFNVASSFTRVLLHAP